MMLIIGGKYTPQCDGCRGWLLYQWPSYPAAFMGAIACGWQCTTKRFLCEGCH